MIHFHRGCHTYELISLLSYVGECPVTSLYLLGNERVYKSLIQKLTATQMVRNDATGEEIECRVLTITGKGAQKTIRLYKSALRILDWIHPEAYGYYMKSFWNHKFPGDASHRERNHRVAESAVMCMRAGLMTVPYELPQLQNRGIKHIIPVEASFYLAKDIKRVGESEMNKTMFTRMTGAVFSQGGCYAVYNTRSSVMKWNGMGEFKALHSLIEVARMNAGVAKLDSAILIGKDAVIAEKTLQETERNRRLELRFDAIYQHIHYIEMSEHGIRQLRLLLIKDWKRKILELLFEDEELAGEQAVFEYDAFVEGCYVFIFFDGDIARLMRFRDAIGDMAEQYEVLCFPHQMSLVRSYLLDAVRYKTIDMELIEQGLMQSEGVTDG